MDGARKKHPPATAKYRIPRASTFTLPSLPFSPSKPGHGRTPSGPISLLPSMSRQSSVVAEPTSPKVSCIGQVRRKHTKQNHKNQKNNQKEKKEKQQQQPLIDNTKMGSILSMIFGTKKPPRTSSSILAADTGVPLVVDADPLVSSLPGSTQPIGSVSGSGSGSLWNRRAVGPLKPLQLPSTSCVTGGRLGCDLRSASCTF